MPHCFVTIPVTWSMPTSEFNCEYYYTTSGVIYSDNAIKKYTRKLFDHLTSQIRKGHPEYGTWELTYILSRASDAVVL